MVVKSFLKCGITNSMDGTEDYSVTLWLHEGKCHVRVSETERESLVEDDQWVYDDEIVTEDQFNQLFGESDDEEFDGF